MYQIPRASLSLNITIILFIFSSFWFSLINPFLIKYMFKMRIIFKQLNLQQILYILSLKNEYKNLFVTTLIKFKSIVIKMFSMNIKNIDYIYEY